MRFLPTVGADIMDATEPLRFERLLAAIAARFVNIGSDDVDEAIVDCQRQLVLALDIDRSALFELVGDDMVYTTHSWTRPELGPPLPASSGTAAFPWYNARVRAGRASVVRDTRELPSAVDRDAMVRVGTKANVVLPLIVDGAPIGALTFAAMRATRDWPEPLVERLRLVADVFAQALARRQSHLKLQSALEEVHRLRDRLSRENEVLHHEVKALRPTGTITAESAAAKRALERLALVAPTNATVLLEGETGSGKEVFAQEIHLRSPRHARPMVRVNCGAIPTALIESELFGRERGAYTGAVSRQIGRFEMAEGSTIFLDEVSELPLEAQVKLLRVLQDRTLERLGSAHTIKVDVRVIAATNRNLAEAVAARTFREDLYYRLNVFPLAVPPLRERVEDIPVLVWHFVEGFCRSFGKTITSIPQDCMDALQRYAWPGNIRQLRNVIEHAMIVATGPVLHVQIPAQHQVLHCGSRTLVDVEAAHIRTVLESTGWRVRGRGGAAEVLGMKATTLEGRMAKLGIKRAGK